MLRTGLAIVALSSAACAVASGYGELLAYRAAGGVGSTMFSVSSASLLIKRSPPAMRGRAAAAWATGWLLGGIAGPVLGGVLMAMSMKAPFLIYAALLVLVAVTVGGVLPAGRTSSADPEADRPSLLKFRDALLIPTFRACVSSNFLDGWIVHGIRVALVPLFVVDVLGGTSTWSGVALTAFAAGAAATLTVGGSLADRWGRKQSVLVGSLVVVVATAWLGFSGSPTQAVVWCALSGAGMGLLTPPVDAAVLGAAGDLLQLAALVHRQRPHEHALTITEIHLGSRRSYGAPRVHAELRMARDIRCGRKRVARLQRVAGIAGICHRRKRGRGRPPPAPHDDLVQRRFVADGPDLLWASDITEHSTAAGKVYCCAVIDAYSRMIVGWSIADHMRTELVVDALQMATWRRRPAPGAIVHADRGSQYTSWIFGHRLREAGLLGSISRVASSVDNTLIESFWSTMQRELLDTRDWDSPAQLSSAIFEWIEAWYNPRRRHTSIGHLAPADYERLHTTATTATTAA